MSNLQVRKTDDGLELVVDNTTGEVFATIRAYARMSGRTQPAISMRCQGDKFPGIKTGEILTNGGLQGVKLIPSDIVFLWMMKDKPELALAMGKAGAGFKSKGTFKGSHIWNVNQADWLLLQCRLISVQYQPIDR